MAFGAFTLLGSHQQRPSPGSAGLLCPSHLVLGTASEVCVNVLHTMRIFQRDCLTSHPEYPAEPGVNPYVFISKTRRQACLAVSLTVVFFPLFHPILLSRGDPAASG